jgi:hypothetical protein
MPNKRRGRPGGSGRPRNSAGWLRPISALCVGGGCRQPCRRHHGTRTKERDGALCLARNAQQRKGGVAILPTLGDGDYECAQA